METNPIETKVTKEDSPFCRNFLPDWHPKNLISIVPADSKYMVKCKSDEKGKVVMDACKVGCIGCTLCVQACNFDAIKMVGNYPVIDQEKCKKCGLCAMKCPKKAIEKRYE